jgi:hypothetical protein
MQMPGRTFVIGNGYRYSINGQEKTPEIAPNTTTAEFWQYDARIVRRWNVDPLPKAYESSYAAFGNNPLSFIDPNGADTLKIKGTNNSQWTIHWGKGTNSTTYDLNDIQDTYITDFLIKDSWLDIGNRTINLDEAFPRSPDLIGLDIYGGGNIKFIAGGGGFNFLWHTRGREIAGEGGRPEFHTYNDIGVQPDFKSIGAGVSASLIVGWADKAADPTGHSRLVPDNPIAPASNQFVTNGVNWTGRFNVVNGSFTVGRLWGKVDASVTASKFSSIPIGSLPAPGETHWWGYSIGFGLGVSANPTKAIGIGDVIKLLNKTTVGVHQQYYYLMYGNGGDKLNNGKNVSGWHISNPIDPEDNK